jgi:hypothetical protein
MESVRGGLRKIAGDLLRSRPTEEAVSLAWPLVCGKEVAARTSVVSFSSGNVTIEVSDPAWRTQLLSFAPKYVSAFAELIGPVVQGVRFELRQHHGKQGSP